MKKIVLFFVVLLMFGCGEKTVKKEEVEVDLGTEKAIKKTIVSEDEILFGAIYSLSGEAEGDNSSSVYGIKLAVDLINNSGGILGKKIKIKWYDNESSKVLSKIKAEEAVKDDPFLVLGCGWSSHSLQAASVLQDAKIPMITNISTSPEVTMVGDYIFRTCFIDPFQGELMAKFVYRDLKLKTAATVTDVSSGYSKGLSDTFERTFTALGGQISAKLEIRKGDTDFTEQVDEIKKSNPEAIYLPTKYRETAFISKQLRANDVNSILVGGDSWSVKLYDYDIGEIMKGSYFTAHWAMDNPSPENEKYISSFENFFNQKIWDRSGTPLAYDTLFLIKDVLENVGEFDREKFKEKLENVENYKGITGDITMGENRNPKKSAIIKTIDVDKFKFYKEIKP